MINWRQSGMAKAGAILSRLLVILVLALSALPQVHSDRPLGKTGPAAEIYLDQAQGILNAEQHLLRAHLTGGDAPDPATLIAGVPARHAPLTFHLSVPHSTTPLFTTLRILPPVRGPPVV